MTREWNPGDVALVKNEYGVWNVAICALSALGTSWRYGVADSWMTLDAEARRLVVIDPEDREQVERLLDLAESWLERVPYADMSRPNSLTRIEAGQQALRALLAPPKPEEPTGLGAVVEDAEGRRYVRGPIALADMHWNYVNDSGAAICAKWVAVPAIRVLSEGVS